MPNKDEKIWALRRANLVFLAVIVFLMGMAAYFALNWRVQRAASTYVGPVAAPSATGSPAAGWKEVKEEFFSFRYPPSWQERRVSTGDTLLFGPPDEEGVFLGVQKGTDTNIGNTPEKLASQALGKGETALVRKTMLVSGHSAVVQERKSGEGVRFEAYIGEVKSPKLVYLEAKTPESVSPSREIFEQILGSFQLFP
jgi:hypothetical protein